MDCVSKAIDSWPYGGGIITSLLLEWAAGM